MADGKVEELQSENGKCDKYQQKRPRPLRPNNALERNA